MIARRKRSGRIAGDEEAADRQPVRERLRERDEIRPHAELLEREERPGSAHAGLYLVEGEYGIELARGRDEPGLERDDSALSEHRLEEHEPDVGRHRCAERDDY